MLRAWAVDGASLPPSRELPASWPYIGQLSSPTPARVARGQMSNGSGVVPLPATPVTAPVSVGDGTPPPPPAVTLSVPCIQECSEQWNWYWPGWSFSTPLTGDDSPAPMRSLL